jgi:hypothetical protein
VFKSWVALDVGATGAASFCGIVAALLSLSHLKDQQQGGAKRQGITSTKRGGGSGHMTVLSLSAVCFGLVAIAVAANLAEPRVSKGKGVWGNTRWLQCVC